MAARVHSRASGGWLPAWLLVLGSVGAAEPSAVEPFLSRPFEGDWPTSGVFDHDPDNPTPYRQLTSWATVTSGRRGHPAWDFSMPVGTPILAAADGVVVEVKDGEVVTCGGGREVTTVLARVRSLADGSEDAWVHAYLHLSRVDVAFGDAVRRGQRVGLSGNTGCSSGPHLHFAVERIPAGESAGYLTDPYGWWGPGADPLALVGRPSTWLWRAGEEPPVFRVRRSDGDGALRLAVQGLGWRDATDPNAEYVEIALSDQVGRKVPLAGGSLTNLAGASWTFPPGAVIRPGQVVRVYSGRGTSDRGVWYMGRDAGVWDDAYECVRLVGADAEVLVAVGFGRKAESPCGEPTAVDADEQ